MSWRKNLTNRTADIKFYYSSFDSLPSREGEMLNLRTEINLLYIIVQTGKLLWSTEIIITFPERI